MGAPLPLSERLRNYRVDARTGCWVWRGNINEDGYGRLWQRVDGKKKLRYAHIVSYEFHVGPSARSRRGWNWTTSAGTMRASIRDT